LPSSRLQYNLSHTRVKAAGREPQVDWLTGGVRGVEASGLVFIVIAAMFGLFHLRHREVKYPMPRS